MSALEEMINRVLVERGHALQHGRDPALHDAMLYLLREQRLVPPTDGVTQAQAVGPGPATNSLVT